MCVLCVYCVCGSARFFFSSSRSSHALSLRSIVRSVCRRWDEGGRSGFVGAFFLGAAVGLCVFTREGRFGVIKSAYRGNARGMTPPVERVAKSTPVLVLTGYHFCGKFEISVLPKNATACHPSKVVTSCSTFDLSSSFFRLLHRGECGGLPAGGERAGTCFVVSGPPLAGSELWRKPLG